MPRQMVGIDIGEREVKLVYTVDGKLRKAATLSLPDNLVENGIIKSMDAMADFLKLGAKEQGIPRGNAAVTLPEPLIFSRNIKMPVMTPAQLKFNLPYEFKDYLTLEKEKYFYDYAIFGTTVDPISGQEEMEMYAAAVAKTTVADYRAMLRRAGFKLKVIIPAQWAYVSVLRQYGLTGGTVCLVDLGHHSTRVHVMADGRPASRRSIDVGIQGLEDQLAEDFHVDVHMARTYKLSNFGGALSLPTSQQLYEKVGVEVLKTVNFYNYNNREVSLQSICPIGGGAYVEPLRQSLYQVTGLQVLTLGQLIPELEGQERYLKAFGCALSG